MDAAQKRIETLASSLGAFTLEWSYLDRKVDALMVPLLQCSQAQVAAIVANIENLSSRCEIIKRLAVLDSPSPKFRDWLIPLLDRVSGELAPRRNRYLHDNWVSFAANIYRVDKRAKIVKGQSREPPELIHDAFVPTTAEEVDRLTFTVTAVVGALDYAARTLQCWRDTGQPQEPDQQWLPVSKPNVRYRTPQEQAEALEQGLEPSAFVGG